MEEEAKKLSIGRAVAKEVIFYAGGRYTIIKYLDDWEKALQTNHCKKEKTKEKITNLC